MDDDMNTQQDIPEASDDESTLPADEIADEVEDARS